MIFSFLNFGATMTLPGETEAGSAGKQPCRGIAWWAHRDDDLGRANALLALLPTIIGSVDPYALKIPARRAESTLTEYARIPFHAEPEHNKERVFEILHKVEPLTDEEFMELRKGSTMLSISHVPPSIAEVLHIRTSIEF